MLAVGVAVASGVADGVGVALSTGDAPWDGVGVGVDPADGDGDTATVGEGVGRVGGVDDGGGTAVALGSVLARGPDETVMTYIVRSFEPGFRPSTTTWLRSGDA